MRCSALGARPKRCPDLAIEIVPTNESIDKLEIYKRLRVREVWFWQTREVRAYMRWLERH